VSSPFLQPVLGMAEAEPSCALHWMLYASMTSYMPASYKHAYPWDALLHCVTYSRTLGSSCAPVITPYPLTHCLSDSLPGSAVFPFCSKEVRQAHISSDDPGLVGLTSGAAVVRRSQQTRHALHILQRVQLMQGAADSESDAAKPLQVALGVAQDVSRQLPFTVLPTVLTAWVALVQGKNNGPLAGERLGKGMIRGWYHGLAVHKQSAYCLGWCMSPVFTQCGCAGVGAVTLIPHARCMHCM
jgi:hypothetical protein